MLLLGTIIVEFCMAFQKFTTKDELMNIIYSVKDTVQLNSKSTESEFALIESFGFTLVTTGRRGVRLHGITYQFIDDSNDTTVYVSFSNPCKLGSGIAYMINKHFFSTSQTGYHREDSKPAFISYHGNGTLHEEHFWVNGQIPDITIINDKEYSYLSNIKTTKSNKEYVFKKQRWHATKFKVNIKTMTPLQVVYYNEKLPTNFIEFHSLKKIYADVGRLVGYERIDLNKSLTPDEITLLDMLTF